MPSLSEPHRAVRPQSPGGDQPRWQTELREAVLNPAELLRLLGLREEDLEYACDSSFPLRVPKPFIKRMQHGNPEDPLLLQVWPLAEEKAPQPPGYSSDPVGDMGASRSPGLLHKYSGRALLVTTGSCAVHCRYCFRREFPYSENSTLAHGWETAIDTIAQDPSIHEVILSGGDPLMLTDSSLARLIENIKRITHIRRLRIHTRLPIVIPSRVTNRLVSLLSQSRLKSVVVVHTNHANELDGDVHQALRRLGDAGALLLNQSVLLRRVNDSVTALADLSERLIDFGVTPYYLHMLDRVIGAAHFEVAEETAKRLIEKLRSRLPGYAVPRLAREEPGLPNKTVLA